MSPPAELILIVDDHPLMLEAIHLSVRPLFENPEFEFAGTLSEALVGVARRAPRLILLDLSLPDAGGLDGVFRMRAARPQSTLIVVSARDDQITVALTRALGVDGFISKSQSAIDIRRHVRSVLDGEIVFPSLADAGAAIATLTPAQARVLAAVATGKLNKQIAFELGVSVSTVKSHLFTIFKKIGVENRTKASLLFSHLR
jgi:DNA-binding NarL/FixJ family response regulator